MVAGYFGPMHNRAGLTPAKLPHQIRLDAPIDGQPAPTDTRSGLLRPHRPQADAGCEDCFDSAVLTVTSTRHGPEETPTLSHGRDLFVQQEFDEYLKCCLVEHGFLRIKSTHSEFIPRMMSRLSPVHMVWCTQFGVLTSSLPNPCPSATPGRCIANACSGRFL